MPQKAIKGCDVCLFIFEIVLTLLVAAQTIHKISSLLPHSVDPQY